MTTKTIAVVGSQCLEFDAMVVELNDHGVLVETLSDVAGLANRVTHRGRLPVIVRLTCREDLRILRAVKQQDPATDLIALVADNRLYRLLVADCLAAGARNVFTQAVLVRGLARAATGKALVAEQPPEQSASVLGLS